MSAVIKLILSLTSRSARTIPTRIPYIPTNSPTVLSRRFPKWSISSNFPFPAATLIKYLIVSIISVFVSKYPTSEDLRLSPNFLFILYLPTSDKEYLLGLKNKLVRAYPTIELIERKTISFLRIACPGLTWPP